MKKHKPLGDDIYAAFQLNGPYSKILRARIMDGLYNQLTVNLDLDVSMCLASNTSYILANSLYWHLTWVIQGSVVKS